MKTKLQKEAVENLLRFLVVKFETDKLEGTKKQKDTAVERLWAVWLLADAAGVGHVLEKIKDGRSL